MNTDERLAKLKQFNDKNSGLTNEMGWNTFLNFFELFKDFNLDYSIQEMIEEDDGDLIKLYNRFVKKHGQKFNLFDPETRFWIGDN